VGADLPEHADRVCVGVEPVGEAVLDEALDQVLQWPGAGRLVDAPLGDVPDHLLQNVASAGQGHLGVFVGDPQGFLDAVP
jgi:hypothetical protein